MMQIIIDFFNQNAGFLSCVISLITWILGIITRKNWEGIKRCLLIRKLRIKKERDWNIFIRLYEDIQLAHYTSKFNANEECDVKSAMNMYKFLQKNGLLEKQKCYVNKLGDDLNESDNVICIGGFIANKQTEYYFKRFFQNFRVYTGEIKKEQPNWEDKYVYSQNKRGFLWGKGDGKEYLVNENERYAILVRLTGEDFGIEGAGTVYILHGNDPVSTLGLSKYIFNCSKDLVRKTRRHKHFFIAFVVEEINGEPRLNMNKFRDLTDEMFPKKK